MKITLIKPSMGLKDNGEPVKTKQMEPLGIAVLAHLTPPDVEIAFYDDRIEKIPYDQKTDLVAIAVETLTAKRAYQISSEFRKRNTKVVLGGFHPTLMPEEASKYADSIIIGEAEHVWNNVLADAGKNNLQKIYRSKGYSRLIGIKPKRDIFKNKKYMRVGLIETGRGCRFSCDFCSINAFFNTNYNRRPIKDVTDEIKSLKKKFIIFVDDNITADMETAKELFKALIPLKIRWVSQATINIAHDEELLKLMSQSGCAGLLIGFESLEKNNLKQINKMWSINKIDYDSALVKIHKSGINVFASFIFGYDFDTKESFEKTMDFVTRHKVLIAGFNHLTPYPGTKLYSRLREEGRLLNTEWWLDPNYRFGDVVFKPNNMSPEDLSQMCLEARKKFYSLSHIVKRGLCLRNLRNPVKAFLFFLINLYGRKKVLEEQGLLLGGMKSEIMAEA